MGECMTDHGFRVRPHIHRDPSGTPFWIAGLAAEWRGGMREGRGEGGGKREDPARIGSLHQTQLDGCRDSARSTREGKNSTHNPFTVKELRKRDWYKLRSRVDYLFVKSSLFMFSIIPMCAIFIAAFIIGYYLSMMNCLFGEFQVQVYCAQFID